MAERAQEFVVGLETAGFHDQVTEDLYIGFEYAAEVRAANLEEMSGGP